MEVGSGVEDEPMPARHPRNAPGPFYVEDEVCILCGAPSHEAPELMCSDDELDAAHSCYFKRQPTNAAETARAVRALEVSCCRGLRYGGKDPAVLEQLASLGLADCCDES